MHRDVRIANLGIYNEPEKGATGFIFDFSAACPKNERTTYSGTMETTSKSVRSQYLKDPNSVEVRPEDDLESLFLTLWCVVHPGFTPVLGQGKTKSRVQAVNAHYEKLMESHDTFKSHYDLFKERMEDPINYDNVAKYLSGYFFETPYFVNCRRIK